MAGTEEAMTSREHLLLTVAAIFVAEHNKKKDEEIFKTVDRALQVADVYLQYCEKKLGITY